MANSMTRSRSDKVIAGVCGGLARQFNIDSNLLRVLFVLAAIFLQFGWVIYVALWLLLPYEDGGPSGLDSLKKQFGNNSSN
ncbi:MAG: PspC domain-containing protein [Propioniciclava sp.]|uniref:PspC domain-containing protein n=1 Tax=Propioniciclava sp. TaxID=2038686 RepID=UPI0039E6B6CB